MLKDRETISESPRASKLLAVCTEKYGDISWRLVKGGVGVLFLSSIALICYAVVVGQSPWRLPECAQIIEDGANLSPQKRPFGVPAGETNMSHVAFGIGAAAATWPERRRYNALWWRGGEMRGYVWLDEQPAFTWRADDPPYRVSEDASRFPFRSRSGPRSAVRLARIFLETVRLRPSNVRWYVMGDDDTVFFPENLIAVLGKYDHEEMFYIGGPSESVEQDLIHSYEMAFGGGGFALSAALAEGLAEIFDGCLLRYNSLYGSDQRVAACVSELGVPLTREAGFHQLDIRGDAYGLLAAHPVAPLVSLHHLGRLKPLIPWKTQVDALAIIVEASRVDPARIMQQTFGYETRRNWSVSVAWGYTVQIHPTIVPPMELETAYQTFQTWRSQQPGPFTFNTRPWASDKCHQPLLYFLDDVHVEAGQWSLTTYRRSNSTSAEEQCNSKVYQEASNVTSVEVRAPLMIFSEWRKGPRRYCSSIDARVEKGMMSVQLQRCRPGKSV